GHRLRARADLRQGCQGGARGPLQDRREARPRPHSRITDRLRQGRLPDRAKPRIPPAPGIDANRPPVRRVRGRSQLGILGPARPGSDRVPCAELEASEMTVWAYTSLGTRPRTGRLMAASITPQRLGGDV